MTGRHRVTVKLVYLDSGTPWKWCGECTCGWRCMSWQWVAVDRPGRCVAYVVGTCRIVEVKGAVMEGRNVGPANLRYAEERAEKMGDRAARLGTTAAADEWAAAVRAVCAIRAELAAPNELERRRIETARAVELARRTLELEGFTVIPA